MPHRVVRLGTRRIVVTKPEATALGHLVLDLLVSLHAARALAADACWIEPKRPPNRAVLELRPVDLRVRHALGVAGLLGRAMWALAEALERLALVGRAIRRRRHARSALADGAAPSKELNRDHRFAGSLAAEQRDRRRRRRDLPPAGIDYRRSFAQAPIPITLPGSSTTALEAAADRLGLDLNRPHVALHARESGYKAGRHGGDEPTDAMRNARIEHYFDAIDFLVEEGITVVRIGDASMTPLARPGVIDLATAPQRTDLLELWIVMRAAMLIACDSGPFLLGWLLANVPCLAVNSTNPLAGYPLLPDHLYILKTIVHRPSGHVLSLPETVGSEYLVSRKNLDLYEYIENSPAEILAATRDMLASVREGSHPSESQLEFRRLALAALALPEVDAMMNRSEQPFYLGDGLIAPSFAADRFEGSRPLAVER